ncbi:unnamed protein product [Brachionus calyciflorus]|uniref:PDZ domain-containing protein n=1 Tax=Brachionus calyciflorus TaxID=104777 RepID=A0A813WRV5_9BILA|nr:unnamed protein product [Brachionus calyciflorus]
MFNLFSNFKNILNQSKNADDQMVLNKHIRFDADTDEESDMNKQLNKNEIKCEIINLNLVKIRSRREKSFGFEVQGNADQIGEHYIDSVQDDSPAGRVGLQKFDKILKVNGIDVTNLNANSLIDLLEYETDLNENKLNLTLSRPIDPNDSNDSSSSKRSLDSKDANKGKKKRTEKTEENACSSNLMPIFETESNDYDYTETSRSLEQLRIIQIEQVKFVSPSRPFKKSHIPSKSLLNSKAREIQIKLSKLGKYVSWAEIVYELLQLNNCDHIGDFGFAQADNLEVINELIRIQKRIDNIIISSEIKVPFVTLLDLEKFIVTDYNHNSQKFNLTKIRDFEDLYVGPLIKNQIIRRLFQIPDNVNDKEQLKLITGSELLKHLVNYLRDNDLWSTKIKQPEFEEYLIKKLKVNRIQDLGIKIINLGIIIGALKTVQHLYSENLKSVRTELEVEIKEFYKNEKIYLMKKLEKYGPNYQYLQSDSIEIIQDFLYLFENLLDKNEYYYINDFLGVIKDSPCLRDCFQLAICLGKHELNESLDQIEKNMNDSENEGFYHKYKGLLKRLFFLILEKNSKTNRELKRMFNKFLREKGLKIVDSSYKKFSESDSEPEIIEEIECLDKKLENFLKEKFEPNSTITLDHLKKIESYLYSNQKGNFCELLDKNKFIFDQMGLKLEILNPIEREEIKTLENKYKKDDVLNYIYQLKQGLDQEIFEKNIENLILGHFFVQDINELNLGSLENLIKQSADCIYSGVLSVDSVLDPIFREKLEIEDLINKIRLCPILENLYEFLNWSEQSRFYGNLKDFLIKLNKKNVEIHVLEMNSQGTVLLKLNPESTIETLKNSIEKKDPTNSLGDLISLISLKYRSISRCPKSLIINEIQSSLSTIRNQDELFDFSIKLIQKIPDKFTPQLIFKFIIEPLVSINSDHDITKKIFSKIVSDYSEETIKFFIKIGDRLFIPEWSHSSWENLKNNKLFHEKKLVKNIIPKLEISENAVINREEAMIVDEPIFNIIPEEITSSGDEFSHIQSLRKRYGIGLELNEETRKVTESLTGVIGRSLESLSNELYNKDMHFVLELIQNADDNSYETQQPTLIFLIQNDSITLFNNEIGFSSKNINAICDVKASTKGKHQRGYIGRKGIGFKSVFTVTDRPEIHSNNYHIKFDLSNGHIGYILPNWIDNYEPDLTHQKNHVISQLGDTIEFNTCIKLPLKSESEMQRHKSSSLTNNFNDIKPNLLLFLNRLRKLVILNENFENLIYERVDRDENLVEILNKGESVHKWFVVRDNLKVPDSLKPADYVESTELCLAFPLDDLDNLKKMDVFAYLPLRSFGFKFIIQADFVVPASRQDINQDSEWNQWLAKQIPSLFIKTLEKFKSHEFFRHDFLFYLTCFLKFIPSENEVLGFFQHVPRQIFDLLKNENFMPVLNEKGEILWKKPFECVITDEFIRQYLTSDMLKKYSGRYFLHENLQSLDRKLLGHLGVQFLSLNELIEILEQVFSDSENLKDPKIISKWLLVLQHCLNGSYSIQQEEKFINKLKQLEIIPVLCFNYEKQCFCKEFVSLDKTTVFFDDEKKFWIPDILKKDLVFINSNDIFCMENVKNIQIKQFLKNLGVKYLDPYEIIENHIIRNLTEFKINKPENVLISYLVFIFKNSNNFSVNFNVLRSHLPIKTNKGFLKIEQNQIFISKTYGGLYDLENSLSSYNWTIINDEYFNISSEKEKTSKKNDLGQKWKNFLLNLGLNEIFTPQIIEIPYENNCSKSQKFYLKDYQCHVIEFYMSMTNNLDELTDQNIKEFSFLFRILEENWDSNFSQYKFTSLFSIDSDFNTNRLVEENYKDSSFYSKLKNSKWVLSELKANVELLEPFNVYLKDHIFLNLYGQNIPYPLNNLSKENSNFFKDLNFRHEFKVEDFLNEFEKWICKTSKFQASFNQIKNIYNLFSNQMNSMTSDLSLNEFLGKNFIFVPDFVDEDENKIVPGQFYTLDKVYWSDKTDVFKKYKTHGFDNGPILLETFYSKSKKLKEIFLNDFKVFKSPKIEDYTELLSHISLLSLTNKSPYSYEETLNDVFSVFEILADPTEPHKIIEIFQKNQILPCYKNKWVSLDQNPILVDNDFDLAEKFSDKISILVTNYCQTSDNEFHNLCTINHNNTNLMNFYINILKVNLFSRVLILDLENITTSLSESSKVVLICKRILPYIQYYVYNRPEFSDMLIKDGEKLALNMPLLKFYSVKELENVYRFKHDPNVFISVSNKTCVDLKSSWKFYIRFDCVDNIKDIIKGFIKIFTQGYISDKLEREFVNFCLLMYQFSDFKLKIEDKKEIEKDFGIKLELPTDVKKWSITESNQVLEEGEVDMSDLTDTQSKSVYSGPSKRQKMLALDQLSSNQLNLPQFEQREFEVSNQRIEYLNQNLDQLEDKMRNNFSIKNLNESEKFSKSEMSSLDLIIPQSNFTKKGKEYITKIGRLGELWVNEMLKHKYKNEIERGSIRVEWMNEQNETGLPYDFKIVHFGAAEDGYGNSERFIEVKSTTKMSQEYFPISYNELIFAQKYSSKFEIYRLYNIATDDPNNVKLKIVRNIPDLLNTHGINLFIVI